MLPANNESAPLNLRQSALKGGVWVFFIRIVDRLFYIVRLIVLARLLSPNDFGLMGIAMLMLLILETFTQTGFQTALIQKKEDPDAYLNSAWTAGALRGILLCVVMYFAAPWAGSFLNEAGAVPLIRVLGLSILLNAFTNIGIIYFQKDLDFKKQFFYQSSGSFFDFVVAVICALTLKNAWALIWGYLVGNVTRIIMSYVIHPFRPKFDFDVKKTKELFGFGKWILGSSILGFLTSQGDSLFISKLLGAVKLGYYQMAYRISNMPATEISNVVSMVTFPTYSKLQQNSFNVKNAYFKVLELTAFLLFPFAGLIYVCSSDFTHIFLGEQWLQIIPIIKVLCICGLIRALTGTTRPFFVGVGSPKLVTRIQFVEFIILLILVYPLTIKFGVIGTAFVILLQRLVGGSFGIILLFKTIHFEIKRFLKIFFFPLLSTVVAIAVFFILKIFLFSKTDLLNFMILLLTSSSIYVLMSFIYFKHHKSTLFGDLKAVILNRV